MEEGLLAVEPGGRGPTAGQAEAAKAETDRWSHEEARTFLASVSASAGGRRTRLRGLFGLALSIGARRSELCALRWSDISFEEHRISIERGYASSRVAMRSRGIDEGRQGSRAIEMSEKVAAGAEEVRHRALTRRREARRAVQSCGRTPVMSSRPRPDARCIRARSASSSSAASRRRASRGSAFMTVDTPCELAPRSGCASARRRRDARSRRCRHHLGRLFALHPRDAPGRGRELADALLG